MVEVEKRSEIAVTACGHLVKDLDALARIVVASPHGPKLPKGIEYIGAGISKATVAICAHHVLKVCYAGGMFVGPQGLQEIAFWREASAEVRQLLAPIEACDAFGRWIVAGRCIPLGHYDGRLPAGMVEKAKRSMSLAGIADLHANNIGVMTRDGKACVVCLDYGAGHGDGKQPIMGMAAVGTGVKLNLDPNRCFTGKLNANGIRRGLAGKPCECGRCDGRGAGFHKGMGRNQRKAPLALTQICWTGKPAPCGCAKCEGNRKIGRKREGANGTIGHMRSMAPREPVKAPKADRAHARMLAAQFNPLAPVAAAVAPLHAWEKDVDGRLRCRCVDCLEARCPDCNAGLFGLVAEDCFCKLGDGRTCGFGHNLSRRQKAENCTTCKAERDAAEQGPSPVVDPQDICQRGDCSKPKDCRCGTHCQGHCCENDPD